MRPATGNHRRGPLPASLPLRRLGLLLALALFTAVSLAQDAAPVRVVQPDQGTAQDVITLTGTVTSARSADLSVRVSGLVKRVLVDAGSRVEKGALLIELDDELARLELERASAEVAEGRIRLDDARRRYDEVLRLVEDKHVPKSQAENVKAELEIAAAGMKRVEVERRQQAERVQRHRLLAPFDGVVSRKLTESGEWVDTGTPVLELVAVDEVRVDVQVPQEQYLNADTPATVEVRTDALPGQVFEGRVAAVVPVKDPSSRTFLVRIDVPEAMGHLTPGMSATVALRLARARGALTIPRDAITRQADGSALVWVIVDQDGRTVAAPRRVELGRPLGDAVEVAAGLDASARVVVRGNELLREGREVRVLGP
jgi:RND family efflux transporter MFP subunit